MLRYMVAGAFFFVKNKFYIDNTFTKMAISNNANKQRISI